jgi:hypothetical protein
MSEPITFVCMSTPRLNNLKQLIPKVMPYVDRAVIVIGREDKEAIDYLLTFGQKMTVVYRKWDDNFANQWNEYLRHVKEGWILICDDDEIPSPAMLDSLRGYVNAAQGGQNFCCVEFRSNAIYIDDQGKEHDSGPNNYWRQILFKKTGQMQYRGGTNTGCHQYLVGYLNNRIVRSDHVYYHIKSVSDEHRNAARNYFIYGIWLHGAADGIQREEWHELRKILAETNPSVKTWTEMERLLIAGDIHPNLKDWMRRWHEKFKTHNEYNEMRAICSYYFRFLHPEEKLPGEEF